MVQICFRADPVGPIYTEIGRFVGVDDLIIQSNFGFNIFTSFRPTRGHRYNIAAAITQPVIIGVMLTDCGLVIKMMGLSHWDLYELSLVSTSASHQNCLYVLH